MHSLSVVSRGRGVGGGGGVLSLSLISDLSNVAVVVIDVVVDVLDPAVRKSNGVRTLPLASSIIRLSSVEVGVGVVVSDGVLVGVGRDLIGVHLSNSVGNGVGNSVDRGVVSRGGMNNRGSMVDHRGSMDQGCGMGHSMAKTVSNNAMGKTVSDNAMGKSVANDTVSEAVSGNNSVSKTVSGQELGGGRGSSQQGGDASKGLDRSRLKMAEHHVSFVRCGRCCTFMFVKC